MFNLTLPSFVLGIIISSLYGAAFHLWKNGGFWKLILYIIFSWVGFWVGHALSFLSPVNFFVVGPLNLGIATLSSWVFIILGHWLSKVNFKT
jgi:hypothetical protein